jgi:hypothetical protein
MTQHLYQEWRGENENRKYPFSDLSVFRSEGGVAFPLGLVIDARLYAYGSTSALYLSRISRATSEITIEAADDSQVVGSAVIPVADLPPGGPVVASLSTAAGRPLGVLLVDSSRLRVLLTEDGVDLTFARRSMPFAASALVPLPRAGVSAIVLETGEIFSGDVWLVAGPGVRLSAEAGVIRVDTVGDPEWAQRECLTRGKRVTPLRCLKTINGVGPDAYGNIRITSGSEKTDNVFRIETGSDGLFVYAAGVRL